MNRLPVAVIGCGHLGRIHAQLLAHMEDVELVAVADPVAQAREALASQLAVPCVADYRELIGKAAAIVLAAPTSLHAEIAHDLIEEGIHLLVEKPLAASFRDADRLAKQARLKDVTIAVGHVERFNPAYRAILPFAEQPILVEATRTGPFPFRSMDVGVVMDLMIHDLELVLALVDSSVEWVTASGGPVLTRHEDFATAQVGFSNGCIAQFKASRTSPHAERTMTVYTAAHHCFVNFGSRTVQVLERSESLQRGTLGLEHWTTAEIEPHKGHVFESLLPLESLPVPEANPLHAELRDFLDSVRGHHRPCVDAQHAATAVWLAEQVLASIDERTRTRHAASFRRAA